MREKQQRSRPRTAAVRIAVGCLAGSLAASALVTPALAAPAVPGTASGSTPGLMVSGAPQAIAADPTTHTFWVSEAISGNPTDAVVKITESGHAVTPFTVASGVSSVAVDPVKGLVWAASNGTTTHTVTLIKESDGTVTPVSVSVGSSIVGLAVDKFTAKLIVVDVNGDILSIDETHPTATPVTLATGAVSGAQAVALDPAGTGTIWVASGSGNSVSAFNEANGHSIGSPAAVGSNPNSLAVDTVTKTVWVTNSDGTVSDFAESAPGTVHTLTLDQPAQGAAVDTAKGQAYLADLDGKVYQATEKTSPPSIVSSVAPWAPFGESPFVTGVADDPSSGQLWVISGSPSQGSFENILPLAPAKPTIISAASTLVPNNDPSMDTFQVNANAFPGPATFGLSGAPSWVAIGKTTGLLTATLTPKSKTGAFKFTILVTNSVGTSSQTFTLNVGAEPRITSRPTATFAFGVKMSFKVTATGLPAPTVGANPLPPGLTISKNGLLSGTVPKGTKTPWPMVVFATSSLGSPAIQMFTLKFVPGVAPRFVSRARLTFRNRRKVHFVVRTTGFPAAHLKIVRGRLPRGLRFRAGLGGALIFGAPFRSDARHTYRISISAFNGVGRAVVQLLTIKIT
ncbi:MAG TPA: hypothetical protein VNF47_27895 [Streptosporangiaceae bacterium]|nr:hypothetical protein [Streptosporangiaceae bacterium]